MLRIDQIAVRLAQCLAVAVPVAAAGSPVETSYYNVIYNFTGQHDGGAPGFITAVFGHVIAGITKGGKDGAETVYKFNAAKHLQATLHRFTSAAEGTDLNALVVYGNGYPQNLTYPPIFGSAKNGGSSGNGLLYKLDSQTGAETVLYDFAGGSDGSRPKVTLVVGTSVPPYTPTGLFGITPDGGAYGDGTIFRLDLATGIKTILYSFTGGSDGKKPADILQGYGISQFTGISEFGGDHKHGVFWTWDGASTVTPTYAFSGGADGGHPVRLTYAPPASDHFVTTTAGGALGHGTLTEITLHPVTATPRYNYEPGTVGCGAIHGPTYGDYAFLVGTASNCGAFGHGTVFSLNRPGSIIHSFSGGVDGGTPYAGVIGMNHGFFVGTTESGGAYGWGTIFEASPQ